MELSIRQKFEELHLFLIIVHPYYFECRIETMSLNSQVNAEYLELLGQNLNYSLVNLLFRKTCFHYFDFCSKYFKLDLGSSWVETASDSNC